jgi:hypothetical protein
MQTRLFSLFVSAIAISAAVTATAQAQRDDQTPSAQAGQTYPKLSGGPGLSPPPPAELDVQTQSSAGGHFDAFLHIDGVPGGSEPPPPPPPPPPAPMHTEQGVQASGDGGQAIGLLLPAVQKARDLPPPPPPPPQNAPGASSAIDSGNGAARTSVHHPYQLGVQTPSPEPQPDVPGSPICGYCGSGVGSAEAAAAEQAPAPAPRRQRNFSISIGGVTVGTGGVTVATGDVNVDGRGASSGPGPARTSAPPARGSRRGN